MHKAMHAFRSNSCKSILVVQIGKHTHTREREKERELFYATENQNIETWRVNTYPSGKLPLAEKKKVRPNIGKMIAVAISEQP